MYGTTIEHAHPPLAPIYACITREPSAPSAASWYMCAALPCCVRLHTHTPLLLPCHLCTCPAASAPRLPWTWTGGTFMYTTRRAVGKGACIRWYPSPRCVLIASPHLPTLACLYGTCTWPRAWLLSLNYLCSGQETKSNVHLRSHHLLTTIKRRQILWALSAHFRRDLDLRQTLVGAASRRRVLPLPTRSALSHH